MTDMTLDERIDEAAYALARRWTAMLLNADEVGRVGRLGAQSPGVGLFTKPLVGDARSGDPEKDMAL